MGGTKKKPISQAEKAQAIAVKKQEKEAKAPQKIKRDITMPKIDEKQAIKIFGPMKAITVYNTAKTLNIKASVASALLKSLEAKGILRKFGGYSGHYVYALASGS
jgi:small subunit ribosomal protein S25e